MTKVSVVVPVYNAADVIQPCIDSLLGQSMPTRDLELIFVDDGSTDDSPRLLDEVAAAHHHVRVFHRENSGGPSQPRNDGIEAATGEFVQFVDNDDWLHPEALERLHAFGTANDADVVIGKVTSNGRVVSQQLFRGGDVPRCTLHDSGIIHSLTPHKMFRRSLLVDHGIRFPLTPRLEDQPFVLRAYAAARNVSILASYPCYHFTQRSDGPSHSHRPLDPVEYYRALEDVLDVLEEVEPPGSDRDRLGRRFLIAGALSRLSEKIVQRLPAEDLDQRLAVAQDYCVRRFTPAQVQSLLPVSRLRAALVVAGSRPDVVTVAQRLTTLRLRVRTTSVQWAGTAIDLEVEAELVWPDGEVLSFPASASGHHLDPRLLAALRTPLPEGTTRVGTPKDLRSGIRADVKVRERDSSTEWEVPTRQRFGPSTDGVARVLLRARLDPQALVGGRPLQLGTWDVQLRVDVQGVERRAGVPAPEDLAAALPPAVTVDRARLLRPYTTTQDTIAFTVRRLPTAPAPDDAARWVTLGEVPARLPGVVERRWASARRAANTLRRRAGRSQRRVRRLVRRRLQGRP